MNNQKTTLKECNEKLRQRDYIQALRLYKIYAQQYPNRAFIAQKNLNLIAKILSQKKDKSKVDQLLNLKKPKWLEDYYFEKIIESNTFDLTWYIKTYGLKHEIFDNPLEHYLENCQSIKLNPSEKFNTEFYLKANPDVKEAGAHPFIHYITQGIQEKRLCLPPEAKPYISKYNPAPPKYVSRRNQPIQTEDIQTKIIAFYLPQFHEIKENNEWWGTGFTEWTNVKPAKPQFKEHYQPHLPDQALGYYNLLNNSIFKKQIELAKEYGVGGFCFYFYWFGGKRLLEKPVENYLNDSSLDFPFCICWANENWSRRWDGKEQDILISQKHSPEDDINFISETARYMNDRRYIKINSKPILLIYRPGLFPNILETTKRWRDWCRENGIGEIYLIYPQSFEKCDPKDYGFDAAVEFPPNNTAPPNVTKLQEPLTHPYNSTVYDWRALVEKSESYEEPSYTLFRGICPSWDNTARKKDKGTVFINSCPKLFEKWASNAIKDTHRRFANPEEKLIFVNAWNEWAEGAHLEPDQKYGYAWLEAIKNSHTKFTLTTRKILIIGHDAHPHGAQLLCLNLCKHFSAMNFEVNLILLTGGILLKEYQNYASTVVLDKDVRSPQKVISTFSKRGIKHAIINTTVSGILAKYLHQEKFSMVTLVHEMPQVLNQYCLHEQARDVAKYSRKVIFPADIVKQGFEGFIQHKLKNDLIRPQGMYMPITPSPDYNKEKYKADIQERHDIPQGSSIILSAGYADHRKGFDIFIDVAKELLATNKQLYFIWIGHHDHSFINPILNSIPLEYKNNIITPGIIKDPTPYFFAADLYVLSSREDPFPSVVMEALSCLTPVIAFKDSGGAHEIISEKCGISLAEISCTALSNAILELLENKSDLEKMGKNGRALVEEKFQFRKYIFDLVEHLGTPLKKVSAVVPNYNYAKLIKSRLASIEAQSYPIYELIILDDCSTDNSTIEIESYLSSTTLPFRIIANKVNSKSVFRQWQLGASLAQGDYIWIAEADDLSAHNFVEEVSTGFDVDNEVLLCYSQSKQIDELGNVISENYLDYTSDVGDYWNNDYIVTGAEEIKRSFSIKNTIPNVSAVIFKSSALMSTLNQHLDDIIKYKVAGDWLTYIYICKTGKISYTSRSLNHHRRHSRSVTKKNSHLDEVIALQKVAASFYSSGPIILEKAKNYIEQLKKYFSE